MITYTFKDEPLAFKNSKKAKAQTIGRALARISDENKGRLTPRAVVAAAEDTRSPLHKHFEWDDTAAASKWRERQASKIIAVIHVEDLDVEEGTARAFLSVTDKGGVSYRQHAEVKSSIDLQLAVLQTAERDLEAFERRFRNLTDICDMVRVAREKVVEQRHDAEQRVHMTRG